jgi:hypothetical protein
MRAHTAARRGRNLSGEVGLRYSIRVAGLALALASVAALAVACGGKATGSAGPAPSGQNAFQAYLTCLSQHGVTLPQGSPSARADRSPGPRPSGGRPSGPRPSGPRGSGGPGGGFGFGGPGGFGFGDQAPPGVDQDTWTKAQQACASLRPSQPARNNGALTAYRNCLADHGVTMSQGPGALDSNDPKVAAALKACEPLRPSNLPTARPSR